MPQGSGIRIVNSKLAPRLPSLLTALRKPLGKWNGNVKTLQTFQPVFFRLRFTDSG